MRKNLSSALILEDDVDWDIRYDILRLHLTHSRVGKNQLTFSTLSRLKRQLYDFALSSNALTQPLLNTNPTKYADPTYPIPLHAETIPSDISFDNLPSTAPPISSPYGDNWGLLWIGHCGMNIPIRSSVSPEKIPRGRVVRTSDNTVPQTQHLQSFYNDWAENFGYGNRA